MDSGHGCGSISVALSRWTVRNVHLMRKASFDTPCIFVLHQIARLRRDFHMTFEDGTVPRAIAGSFVRLLVCSLARLLVGLLARFSPMLRADFWFTPSLLASYQGFGSGSGSGWLCLRFQIGGWDNY